MTNDQVTEWDLVAHLGPAGWFMNAWKREVAWAEAAEEAGADMARARGSVTEGNGVRRGRRSRVMRCQPACDSTTDRADGIKSTAPHAGGLPLYGNIIGVITVWRKLELERAPEWTSGGWPPVTLHILHRLVLSR
jgi:hypothetical protein